MCRISSQLVVVHLLCSTESALFGCELYYANWLWSVWQVLIIGNIGQIWNFTPVGAAVGKEPIQRFIRFLDINAMKGHIPWAILVKFSWLMVLISKGDVHRSLQIWNTGQMPFLPPNQQRPSTEGKSHQIWKCGKNQVCFLMHMGNSIQQPRLNLACEIWPWVAKGARHRSRQCLDVLVHWYILRY